MQRAQHYLFYLLQHPVCWPRVMPPDALRWLWLAVPCRTLICLEILLWGACKGHEVWWRTSWTPASLLESRGAIGPLLVLHAIPACLEEMVFVTGRSCRQALGCARLEFLLLLPR